MLSLPIDAACWPAHTVSRLAINGGGGGGGGGGPGGGEGGSTQTDIAVRASCHNEYTANRYYLCCCFVAVATTYAK